MWTLQNADTMQRPSKKDYYAYRKGNNYPCAQYYSRDRDERVDTNNMHTNLLCDAWSGYLSYGHKTTFK